MDVNAALCSFGFTQLEALVYCELLRSAPATGYRLALDLGKAPPNIYNALKGLVQKGAIVAAEQIKGPASYLPVPPQQLLAAIRQDFTARHDAALAGLEAIHIRAAHESVYQLHTVNQVFERARAMIDGASEILIFDMVPRILDLLRPAIDAAMARGVKVVGIAYRLADAGPTIPYNGESPAIVEERWPGLGLIVIVDGREQIVVQLSRDMKHVLNALYSDSAFLSSVLHSAVSSDIRLVALRADSGDPLADLSIKHSSPPGLRDMMNTDPDLSSDP